MALTPNEHDEYNELIKQAQAGVSSAQDKLLEQYKNMVKKTARTFFIIGADFEDIVQEGMIGLFKAIQSYNEDKEASFETYAGLCITRQILNALKSASRKKHAPLNFYVSLDFEVSGLNLPMEDSPEDLLILKEDGQNIIAALYKVLSAFESKVLSFYLEGMSHTEIAAKMDKNEKSIDNAIQRIRNKALGVFGDNAGRVEK